MYEFESKDLWCRSTCWSLSCSRYWPWLANRQTRGKQSLISLVGTTRSKALVSWTFAVGGTPRTGLMEEDNLWNYRLPTLLIAKDQPAFSLSRFASRTLPSIFFAIFTVFFISRCPIHLRRFHKVSNLIKKVRHLVRIFKKI